MSDDGRPSRACGLPPRSALAETADAQTQPIAATAEAQTQSIVKGGAGDLPGYEAVGGVPRLTKRLTSKTFVDDVPSIPEKFADSMRATSTSFPHAEPSWDSLPDVPSMLETIQLFAADCDDASMAKWQQMLGSAYPSMRDLDVGQQIYNLAREALQSLNAHPNEHDKNCLEYWSGSGMITLFHLRKGMAAKQFDKKNEGNYDCTTPIGLRLWLDALLYEAASDATVWIATECSSFSSVCRAVSKRHKNNEYAGDCSRDFVVNGNKQMVVASILFFISWLISLHPIVEQPKPSCMQKARPLKDVLEFTGASCTNTWLGAFEAPSPKPLQLWHPPENLFSQLQRRKPANKLESLVTTSASKRGRRAFSGRKVAMKNSQVYPPRFAFAVAKLTLLNSC
jgi:hypothetical protein